MRILDCTLRDGGYYNNWDFSTELVQDYLDTMSEVGINLVELGFRQLPKDKFLGACAYTSDRFLNSLSIAEDISVAVMINAKEVLSYLGSIEEALGEMFNPKNQSRVDYVRVAINVNDATQCKDIVKYLNKLGYKVCLNLMQINMVSLAELAKIVAEIEKFDNLEILYFADSMGNLNSDNVEQIVSVIKENCSYKIGFHSHNNMNSALSNAMSAYNLGCYIDGTISGMGRGAGNAQTEYILMELFKEKHMNVCSTKQMQTLIEKYFKDLMTQHNWGHNVYYYLGAINNLHPSYIQQMLSTERYSPEDILNTINLLAQDSKKSDYNPKSLQSVFYSDYTQANGTNVKNMFKGKDVLILASAPELEKHKDEVINYIKSNSDTAVIALNYPNSVPDEYIDYYAICYPTRLDALYAKVSQIKKPIILPKNVVKEDKFEGVEIIDYGLKVVDNEIEILDDGCILPSPIVSSYALSFVKASGAKRALLVGFDGYPVEDDRYHEMKNMLFEIQDKSGLEMIALTPTNYPLAQKSIYLEQI